MKMLQKLWGRRGKLRLGAIGKAPPDRQKPTGGEPGAAQHIRAITYGMQGLGGYHETLQPRANSHRLRAGPIPTLLELFSLTGPWTQTVRPKTRRLQAFLGRPCLGFPALPLAWQRASAGAAPV